MGAGHTPEAAGHTPGVVERTSPLCASGGDDADDRAVRKLLYYEVAAAEEGILVQCKHYLDNSSSCSVAIELIKLKTQYVLVI